MRLVTAAEQPHRLKLVIPAEHPRQRTLFLVPGRSMRFEEIDEVLPGKIIQIRLYGEPVAQSPITYWRRRAEGCGYPRRVEQVNIYLDLLWPKWDGQADARLRSTAKDSNVEEIRLFGQERVDTYRRTQLTDATTFTLAKQEQRVKRSFVHTRPQSA